MANFALGKLPMEKNWKRPEEATDGIITNYTTQRGFAESEIPNTYTLDLGELITVQTIRFLLWDGLGNVSNNRNAREYYYSLLIAQDLDNWETYFDTESDGYNGWQVFEFPKKPLARFVRLVCKHNTANSAFHIVEFEVHNDSPNLPTTRSEILKYQLLDPVLDLQTIEQKIQKAIIKDQDALVSATNRAVKSSNDIDKLLIELSDKVKEYDQVIQGVNLAGKSLFFQQEATLNNNSSNNWLKIAGIAGGAFIIIICLFLSFNNFYFVDIATHVNKKLATANDSFRNNTLWLEFISFLLLKVLLITLGIYIIVFCLRNYRTQRHNYTVNQHKALSIFASIQYLENQKLSSEIKEKILTQATNAVFSHQHSGYDDKSEEISPNFITNFLEKTK